ncbi:hypothetical protein T4A_11451 [Trichinella pseudospiralis]|uniref:Uncharacterized protein n=1 Tax=Trichinella pseudospiralis TaxID=6337 RepID=A0A0V1EG70_TRIPS|nr:hypothetical protein T4A_11451 [Trichinella pseudospiralis]KRZ31262.1 hypothetical protein T4C_6005 [Trichinella pseudospiralis]
MENVDKSAKSCGHMSCKSIFVLGFAKRDTFTFKTVSFQLEFEYCPLVDFLFPIVGFYVKLNEKVNDKTKAITAFLHIRTYCMHGMLKVTLTSGFVLSIENCYFQLLMKATKSPLKSSNRSFY